MLVMQAIYHIEQIIGIQIHVVFILPNLILQFFQIHQVEILFQFFQALPLLIAI